MAAELPQTTVLPHTTVLPQTTVLPHTTVLPQTTVLPCTVLVAVESAEVSCWAFAPAMIGSPWPSVPESTAVL